MPFMALQCFSCHVMQVKEVRKSSSSKSKWSCVLCNEKQSVRKVYNQGDTAKEVRNFVQKFNLTMGQAAQAEGRARLEAEESTVDDSPYDYRYEEDEYGQVNETVGKADHAVRKKSFKWDRFLPEEYDRTAENRLLPVLTFDQEQVCPGDDFQESPDHLTFTTTIPEPPSRRRTRPRSSSPPPKRPSRGLITSTDDDEHGSFIPSDSRETATYTSRQDNSLKLQQCEDSGSEDNTPLGTSTWKASIVPESTSSSLPDLDSGYSPKDVKSCHAQVAGAQTSKWSKYLT